MSVIVAFENWCLKFVNNAEDVLLNGNYGELICSVLSAVDQPFFGGLCKQQIKASEIQEKVCEYLRRFLQTIRKGTLDADLELDMMSESELEHLFGLVFQLCMLVDRQAAIGHIMQLSSQEQEALLPLVKQIIEEKQLAQVGSPRALSVKLKTEESDVSFMSELERKQHEVRELTERNEILERLLKEANEKYDFFLEDNSRLYEEIEQLKSEKEPLLSELGLSYGASYAEILHRFRDVKKQHEADVQTLTQRIEHLRNDLQHSSIEMEMMSHSLVQLKRESQKTRDSEIEEQLRELLEYKSVELNTKAFELKQVTAQARRLQEENERLRKKCRKLQPIYCKFKTLESLHNSFRTGITKCIERVA